MRLGRYFLRKVSFILLFLPPILLIGQDEVFTGELLPDVKSTELSAHLKAYSVYQMNLDRLSEFTQSAAYRNAVTLDFPGLDQLDLELFHHRLQSDDYVRTVQTAKGVVTEPFDGIVKTFRGNQAGGKHDVRLTIDKDYLSGLVEVRGDIVFIQPLRDFIEGARNDEVIIYRQSDVIESEDHVCELVHPPGYKPFKSFDPPVVEPGQRIACREVEIAFADDWLMYDKYNQSVSDVENHNLTVMNNVQTNYVTDFNDEYEFVIVETWISTCSSCDPWTSSTDAGQLLSSFSAWGGNGFSNTHDVAVLWTDRNFDGATIGIAWLDAVCFNNFKYATVQDFTSNAPSLRVLLAHELGHTFGSEHVPGNSTIMTENLNITNDWHPNAVNWINSYMSTVGCLSGCSTGVPPTANFGSDVQFGCAPLSVSFQDFSTGNPTSWNWTFPGGTPGSSTQQNPEVTYSGGGTFDVVLEVSNANGTDSYVMTDYITVEEEPTAQFDAIQDQLTVEFINLSTGADSYFWDFGDGTNGVATDPVHTYAQDGQYEVELTAVNDCGSSTYTIFLDLVSQPYAAFTFDNGSGCEPLVVSFINQSTDNVDTYFWEFPGGNPSTSTEENPVVIYEMEGSYSVTLTVQNSQYSDAIFFDDVIEVAPVPESDFDAVTGGLDVQFVNNSVYADSYLWLFGDGNSSTEVGPDHTYASGGTYDVLLVSSNACGSDTAMTTISLNSAPVAAFDVSASVGCAPFEVIYTSTSSGDVDSYSWSFPGGSPASSNDPSPVVTYQSPGSYSAELVVTNTIGSDTLTIQGLINVQPPTMSDFSFVVNGLTANFQNLSTGATDYTWLIDNQTFTSANPVYNFPADGDYPVMLISDGPCGPDTSEAIVEIVTAPVAGFSANGATTGCEPFEVQFDDMSSANVTSWMWNFPGGIPSTSTDPNPVIQYQQAGTYSVTLVVTGEGGSDEVTMTDLIVVNPQPVAEFSTVQDGLQVSFTNESQDGVAFHWFFGDGSTSTEVDPSYTYGSFGDYLVTLIATNACGSDTAQVNLNIALVPVPMFVATEAQGCVPFVVQFEDESQNGAESWEWTFPGGNPATSTLQNPVVTYEMPGIYDVTLKVSNTAGSQALVREAYIVVGEPPSSSFEAMTEGDIVILDNMSEGALSYLWDFGDGQQDTAANPVHTFAGSGQYVISLIAMNECGADTSFAEVDIMTTSTIDQEDIGEGAKLYPNPGTGLFRVLWRKAPGVLVSVKVSDMLGRIVYIEENVLMSGINSEYRLDLEDNLPGLYNVIIESEETRCVLRAIIQD